MENESTERNRQIFRQESLDRINSPEQLNDYLRVTNPTVWVVLAAVIVLLVGACVWGIFGHMDTVVTLGAEAQDGVVTCYVTSSDIDSVEAGMTITIGDNDYEVKEISPSVVPADELPSTVRTIGEMDESAYAYRIVLSGAQLDDGFYEAKMVTDSVSPMSFVFN